MYIQIKKFRGLGLLLAVALCHLSPAYGENSTVKFGVAESTASSGAGDDEMPISGGILLEGSKVAADYCDTSKADCCFNTKGSCACPQGQSSDCCRQHPNYRGCAEDPFRKPCDDIIARYRGPDYDELLAECCKSAGYSADCTKVTKLYDFEAETSTSDQAAKQDANQQSKP